MRESWYWQEGDYCSDPCRHGFAQPLASAHVVVRGSGRRLFRRHGFAQAILHRVYREEVLRHGQVDVAVFTCALLPRLSHRLEEGVEVAEGRFGRLRAAHRQAEISHEGGHLGGVVTAHRRECG